MARRMLALHGLAALMIPFHHATAYGLAAMFSWGNADPNFDYLNSGIFWVTMFIRQVDSFAIPAFMFVSGFFIAFAALRTSKKLSWKVSFSRVEHLLWPFAIWTIIHFTLQGRIPRSFGVLANQYYYIVLLIQLFLLSPLLIAWVNRDWKSALIVTAVIQVAVMGFRYVSALGVDSSVLDRLITLTPLWFFPSRIFYFMLGVMAGLNLSLLRGWLIRHRRALLVAAIAGLILAVVELYYIVAAPGKTALLGGFTGIGRLAYAVLAILAFLAYDGARFPGEKQLQKLGGQTLGIYLMNTPTIFIVSSLLFHLLPVVYRTQWLYQPILIISGLYIPLFVLRVFRRTPLRAVYRYVFG